MWVEARAYLPRSGVAKPAAAPAASGAASPARRAASRGGEAGDRSGGGGEKQPPACCAGCMAAAGGAPPRLLCLEAKLRADAKDERWKYKYFEVLGSDALGHDRDALRGVLTGTHHSLL